MRRGLYVPVHVGEAGNGELDFRVGLVEKGVPGEGMGSPAPCEPLGPGRDLDSDL